MKTAGLHTVSKYKMLTIFHDIDNIQKGQKIGIKMFIIVTE